MNIDLLSRLLRDLFGELTPPEIEEIVSMLGQENYRAGDYIVQQGSMDNSIYIVVQGLFRSVYEEKGVTKVLGDIGIAEPIGEFAFFTKEPRSASVIALRDSSALKVDEESYRMLSERFPLFPNALTRYIIKRLRSNSAHQRSGGLPKNIALIKLNDDHDVQPFTTMIEKAFADMGTSIRIYDHNSCTKEEVVQLFDDMDDHDGLNFLICNQEDPSWAQKCILYSDLIVIGADFNAEPDIRAIEKEYDLYSHDILSKKVYLLLLHPEDAPEPMNTRKWFKDRRFDMHMHLREHNERDARRFCRIILHQAIGLVLGGGGAKGYAHSGAVRAIMEEGVEFDFVGGSSVGGLLAIALTRSDFDFKEVEVICREGSEHKVTSNDYNLPIISLMTGNKMRKYLKHFLGDIHIEDMWVNTFCVSTNFSTAQVAVHERGLARKVMEASIAIPGVFPPVIIDKQLHVDGGVMDNLPIEAMQLKPVQHMVAISLSASSTREISATEVPSAGRLVWSKLSGKKKVHLPSMTSLLINSLLLNSRQKQESTKDEVSFYLELNLKGFGFLDWSRWKELVDMGYALTKDHMVEMKDEDKFWKQEKKKLILSQVETQKEKAMSTSD